ncbi:MAG: hypothetical protein CVV27_17945 [Candidatus Melainabacteria bacterium HGW-Melainabacteria-1]|nr:MAG: hypothetical protein CVV27_17945 [Candidatus Melainabacteria bacterium HGW-Melainabacteria-1]
MTTAPVAQLKPATTPRFRSKPMGVKSSFRLFQLLAPLLCACSPRVDAESRQHVPPTELLNPDRPLAQLLPVPYDKSKVSLLVEKAKYRLTVYYQETALKSYPVVFGPNPVSDKRREGDNATPEGLFRIRNLYHHDSWSKFLWIDYPTEASWQKHRAAKAAGEIPADATIGGEVGIHGVPNGNNSLIDQRQNWTAGCVSLKNPDVDEIYAVASKGMLVEIIP